VFKESVSSAFRGHYTGVCLLSAVYLGLYVLRHSMTPSISHVT